MRCHDDHEVALALLVGFVAEQGAEHRHRADPGKLAHIPRASGLQHPGDRKTLAVAQFDGGASFALCERRHGISGYHDRVGVIEFTDGRRQAQVDDAVLEHGRHKGELDAIIHVGGGDDRNAP